MKIIYIWNIQRFSDVTAVEHPAADRASAYSLDKIIVDGNDADEMFRTAQKQFKKPEKAMAQV